MKYLEIICWLCALQIATSFELQGNSVEKQTLLAGRSLELKCKTNSNWEYCTWKHVQEDIEDGHVRECHIEWKWIKGGASIEKCDEELSGRVSIIGNYEKNECGLMIKDAVPGDSGKWKCEVEDYVFVGSKGSGPSVTHEFDINIIEESHESQSGSKETEHESHESQPESQPETHESQPERQESDPKSHESQPESHESRQPESHESEVVEDKIEDIGEFSVEAFTEADTTLYEDVKDVTEPMVNFLDDVIDHEQEHTTVSDFEEHAHVDDLKDDVSKHVESEDQLDSAQNYNTKDYENVQHTNNTSNQNDLVDKNGLALEDPQGFGVIVGVVILGGLVLVAAVVVITFLTKKKYSRLSQHKSFTKGSNKQLTKDQIEVVIGECEEPSFQKLLETDKV